VAFFTVKTVDSKNRIRSPERLYRFPWEEERRHVVGFEPWDSPAMLKFSEEADRALAVLNPEAYAKYMAGKQAREQAAAVERTDSAKMTNENEMTINAEINF
jgi:hypothetical protein